MKQDSVTTWARPSPRTTRPLRFLLWALPVLFLFDLILGGPLGFTFGSLPLRHILFGGATFSLAACWLLTQGRLPRAAVAPLLAIYLFLAGNLLWVSLVPALRGKGWHLAWAEADSLLMLAPALLLAALVGIDPRRLHRLQLLVVSVATVLAVIQLAVWLLGTLFPELQLPIRFLLMALFRSEGSSSAIMVGPMADGFFRVFWISVLWCLLAFFWVGQTIRPGGWRSTVRVLLGASLFVSYSRGIWLGTALGLLTVLVMDLGVLPRRFRLSSLLAALATLLVMAGALGLASPRLRAASAADPSISERQRQLIPLLDEWQRYPLLGGGYGTVASKYVRSREDPYSYELVPVALLMKLGVVGSMLLFVAVGVVMVSTWLRRQASPELARSLLAALVAFGIAVSTNPLLYNFVGLAIVSCLLAQWTSLMVMAGSHQIP